MAVVAMDLPGHLHYVALEEMLLLRALENLLESDSSPAAFLTMCTRNELICVAQKMLRGLTARALYGLCQSAGASHQGEHNRHATRAGL